MRHSTTGKIIYTDIQLEKGLNPAGEQSSAQTERRFRPALRFEYIVRRKRYISARRVMGDTPSYNSVAAAVAVIEKYPMGKSVTVFYNPANPKDAVLEEG
jgi:Protein of unknown function (DUF3592)